MSDASARLRLITTFALEQDGEVVPVAMGGQRLLAFLALEMRALPRHRVAGTLWPDTSEAKAMANLRTTLWRLPSPATRIVRTTAGMLSVNPALPIDFHQLRAVARRVAKGTLPIDVHADDPAFGGDPLAMAGDALATAGDLLVDWSDDWVLGHREQFRQIRLHALERLTGHLARVGQYALAVEIGLAAVACEPLRESAHHQLIRVHLAEGNRMEAIRQFESYRRVLQDELGIEPSAEIRGLIDALTRGRDRGPRADREPRGDRARGSTDPGSVRGSRQGSKPRPGGQGRASEPSRAPGPDGGTGRPSRR
jgi:DNA-binding SARP family transcriptional activator